MHSMSRRLRRPTSRSWPKGDRASGNGRPLMWWWKACLSVQWKSCEVLLISTSIPESYFQKLQESNSLRNSINNWPKIPHKPKPQTPYIRDSPSPCRYNASGIEVLKANGNFIKIPLADSNLASRRRWTRAASRRVSTRARTAGSKITGKIVRERGSSGKTAETDCPDPHSLVE